MQRIELLVKISQVNFYQIRGRGQSIIYSNQ